MIARFQAACPGCKLIISKGNGCNHMTCVCGKAFDWASRPRAWIQMLLASHCDNNIYTIICALLASSIWIRDVFCDRIPAPLVPGCPDQNTSQSSMQNFEPHLVYDWGCRPWRARKSVRSRRGRWRRCITPASCPQGGYQPAPCTQGCTESAIFFSQSSTITCVYHTRSINRESLHAPAH